MVVSASHFASEIGVEILKKGGNAFDAAVATGFALAVTLPEAGNIGGGGFLVAFTSEGEPISLDFREKAPARANRNMFLDASGNVIENKSLYSHLAVGVPGTVGGLLSIHKAYGSENLELSDLLEPSILLAEKGFPVGERLAGLLNENYDAFLKDDGAGKIFIQNNGKDWAVGDTLKQTDLAETLRLISKNGHDGFYSGPVADKIIKEMREGNGWITGRDLKNYTPIYRAPVWGTYKEYDIFTMGPPSSGGPLLVEMLNMVETFDLSEFEFNSPEYIHLLTEIERRAYADRSKYLGDPDFYNVPLDTLISKSFAQSRISNFSPTQKTDSKIVTPGDISGWESSETTHYSVVDKDRNCVSVTYTLNMNFGSKIVVDGAGFLLNNEMDDFSSKPGVPNYFGLVGNEANSIQPGKRPLSSMTPTIVLKSGQPYLILGSPGGSRIITNVYQVMLNALEFKMPVLEAVSVPRFHSQWLPDLLYLEDQLTSDTSRKELEEKGHSLVIKDPGYFGAVNAILIDTENVFGGPDVRRDNSAVGY